MIDLGFGLVLVGALSDAPERDRAFEVVAVAAASVLEVAPGCERDWRPLYYSLFSAAEYGRADWERAAWVVRESGGRVRLLTWPFSHSSRREDWRGPTPQDAVAVLHTHPLSADPRPSREDQSLADRLGLPVYAISRAGIYAAEPRRGVRRVEGATWFVDCSMEGGCPHSRRPETCTV